MNKTDNMATFSVDTARDRFAEIYFFDRSEKNSACVAFAGKKNFREKIFFDPYAMKNV